MQDQVQELLEKLKKAAKIAGEAAGQGIDAAGRVAGQALEVTRLRVQIAGVKSDIGVLHREVGAIVHAAHRDPAAPTDTLDEKLEALDAKVAELHELEAKLAVLQKKTVCPACGRACLLEDTYCRACGAKLTDDKEPEEDA